MFYLGIFVGLWIALVVYGLSHDVRRWWFERRVRRVEAREQAAQDLRESFEAVIH